MTSKLINDSGLEDIQLTTSTHFSYKRPGDLKRSKMAVLQCQRLKTTRVVTMFKVKIPDFTVGLTTGDHLCRLHELRKKK